MFFDVLTRLRSVRKLVSELDAVVCRQNGLPFVIMKYPKIFLDSKDKVFDN